MHISKCLASFVLIFFIIELPSYCNAEIDQKVAEAYMKADYITAVKLLEEETKQLKEKGLKNEAINFSDSYQKNLLLANMYAWKLNDFEKALIKYQNASDVRQSSKENSKFPPLEVLFIAAIYEQKKDFLKAREYYHNFLKESVIFNEKERDDISTMMGDELIKFSKYQIDGINLKEQTSAKPLLPKIKLSLSLPIFQFLAIVLVPTAQYDFTLAMKTDLVDFIKQSPINLNSMILNSALVLNAAASSVTESSERAFEAYLLKYPDSYYSLSLRYMFYKFYKESEQHEKAEKLLKEIETVGRKRGIELITGSDKRFSSPEKTWETYKNALIAGDMDTVMECYAPGRRKHKKVFEVLGKEKLKEIGGETGKLEKVSAGKNEAEYMIIRKENNKEFAYEIHFYNLDGEWKMGEF